MSVPATIVVPTCDRPAELAQCLEHLQRAVAAAGGDGIEIVVTDDGATPAADALRERFPDVRWLRGPRRGPAANRNAAVAASRGCWILFTDDDCLPGVDWVRALLDAAAKHPGVRVLEGATTIDRPVARLDEEAPWNERGGYLWACNMAVDRELFLALGGFCETFPAAASEDSDFKLRLDKAGERVLFVPEAVVCHPLRRSRGLRHQFRIGRSYLLLTRRHPEILGRAPWRDAALNAARMLRVALRDGARLRFRGFGFALGRIAIHSGFNLVAILRRGRSA